MDEYLTIEETCRLLKIRPPTLRKWRLGGKIKSVRLSGSAEHGPGVVRYPRAEVERVLRGESNVPG